MKRISTAITAALLLTVAAAGLAPAAHAEQVTTTSISQPAVSQPAGKIIAQDQSTQLTATASAPRAITVHTEPGATVTLQAATKATKAKNASKAVTKKADAQGNATFTKLTAGKEYRVSSSDETTTALPVVPVGKTNRLTARATNDPTSVDLTWQHKATPARGGSTITYLVQATPINHATGKPQPNAQSVSTEVTASQATLTDLDPTAIYEFSVRARNQLGTGKPSIARMSEPLASLMNSPTPANSAENRNQTPPKTNSNPAPAPQPTPKPAPNPGPSNRTIYVCPSGYTENGSNCIKTAPYTYTTRAYTYSDQIETSPYIYHTEVTGPSPILDTFETPNVCPSGYNLEDYGAQGKWCKLYGPAPTTQVKDAPPAGWTDNGTAYQRTIQVKDETPAGFTDNGTEWIKKDAAPSGWNDDGSQYVHTVAKEARIVPA